MCVNHMKVIYVSLQRMYVDLEERGQGCNSIYRDYAEAFRPCVENTFFNFIFATFNIR